MSFDLVLNLLIDVNFQETFAGQSMECSACFPGLELVIEDRSN
jgi:hypothetical protein